MENNTSQHDFHVEHHYDLYIADNEFNELLVFQNIPKQEIRLFGKPVTAEELVKALQLLQDEMC